MNLKYVTGPITKATAGGLDAIISTPKVDTDGESVDPMGLVNRDDWLKNPLVYWSHEWAFDPSAEPVGKGTRLDVFGDRIESSAEWAPTPKAQNVRALVNGGFVRRTSIGFDPIRMAEVNGTPTHTQWALREWSIVPMPANTEATITGVKTALMWLADGIAEPNDDETHDLDLHTLVQQVVEDQLALKAEPDGVSLRDRGRRIALIRRRRIATVSPLR